MKASYVIDIHELKPGMILEKDLFSNGNLLLAKGTVVKPNYIKNLQSHGITKIPVLLETTPHENILVNPVQKFYSETYEAVTNIIDSLKKNLQVTTTEIFPLVEKILETIFTNQDSMLLLTGYNAGYDYLTAHSLDVCVFSLITAKAMNLDYEEIVNLGIGALLHDIGKIKIPDSILLKPGSLTPEEFEEVKKHSRLGYEMALKIPGIKRNMVQVVLQHHERCDGSGYPQQLTGQNIQTLSKIVAIADIYDAMTSDRVYNKRILPHEAAEYLLCISNSLIDWDITKIFLRNIAIYPPGCQVRLNTNQIAIITDPNINMTLRPSLKIITDFDGNPLPIPQECSLETHPNLCITDIFN